MLLLLKINGPNCLPMHKNSTTYTKKNLKSERPSPQVIRNILNYSKSLMTIPVHYDRYLLLVNN